MSAVALDYSAAMEYHWLRIRNAKLEVAIGEFTDKVAVITGGASGIGKATAALIAKEGGSVVICDCCDDAVEDTLAEYADRFPSIRGQVADVASAADMERLIRFTVETFGGIDALVNNAGIQMFGTVVDLGEDDWDRTLAINLKGAFLAAKFAVPEIRKRGGGAIVNVASVHAFATISNRVAYAASKTGLLGLTRAMALDHGPENIRVNVVCPGPVDTPMLRNAWQRIYPGRPLSELMDELAELLPVGYVGRPEEVAEMIAYLVGPRSGFVTGGEFKIEGGVSARYSIAPRP
jgi:NAD(P)-dependent dehydrogenase (short-subunit alcohol dehydrogenase family)